MMYFLHFAVIQLFSSFLEKWATGALETKFSSFRDCNLVCVYSAYCVCETKRLLNHKAIIYSFGLGEEVQFEESMIARYQVINYFIYVN